MGVHPLPDPEGLILKALATRRRQLVAMIAVGKTGLKQAEDALLADSPRAVIALFGNGRAAISGGRPCLRAARCMSAPVAVRHDPAMRAACQARRKAILPARVALIAIARRILITANAFANAQRSDQPPEHHA
jgi:transposase